ncbi:MAG: FkbM family methyltransferase [Bacteroidetes bacterium]|nr:FkbM family methyltransferase [Fibrella sp.]
MLSLAVQEKLRKPLLGFTRFLHRVNFAGAWYQFTGPINRYLIWQSPFFKGFNPTLIVDVGANTGEFILNARAAFPNARLLAFEPHPDAIKTLQTTHRNDSHFVLQPVGLGSETGTATLYVPDFSPGSSIVAKPTGEHREVTIAIRQLDEFIDHIPSEGSVLIKIDVEGYELEVLRGGRAFLAKADYLYLEARTTNAIGCTFEDIHRFMQSIGWAYLGAYDSVFAPSGELLYFDALFKRLVTT